MYGYVCLVRVCTNVVHVCAQMLCMCVYVVHACTQTKQHVCACTQIKQNAYACAHDHILNPQYYTILYVIQSCLNWYILADNVLFPVVPCPQPCAPPLAHYGADQCVFASPVWCDHDLTQ